MHHASIKLHNLLSDQLICRSSEMYKSLFTIMGDHILELQLAVLKFRAYLDIRVDSVYELILSKIVTTCNFVLALGGVAGYCVLHTITLFIKK